MASSNAERYLDTILHVPVTNWDVELAESYGGGANKAFWTGRVEHADKGLRSPGVQVDRFHIGC